MTNDFNVAWQRQGPVVHITPSGELDYQTAPVLEDSVAAVLVGKPWVLVIDLAQLEFIDSTGLRTLLTCKADAEQAGATFQVSEVRAFQRRILEITGLDQILLTSGDTEGQSPN